MPKRKKIVTPVEIGDTIVMRDWNNQWVTIKVQKLSESKVHGLCAEGIDTEQGQYRALPLAHKVETARVTKVKRGTWEVQWPDGQSEQLTGSLASIRSLVQERGAVFQEV